MPTVECSIKGVRHAEPHARVRVEVKRIEGTRWYFTPPELFKSGLYRRGGVHFMLHPETLED